MSDLCRKFFHNLCAPDLGFQSGTSCAEEEHGRIALGQHEPSHSGAGCLQVSTTAGFLRMRGRNMSRERPLLLIQVSDCSSSSWRSGIGVTSMVRQSLKAVVVGVQLARLQCDVASA